MSTPELDAYSLSALLASALDEQTIPYAVGGAIAFGLWGDPRGTHDVDINLFVNHDQFDAAIDVLVQAGVEFDRAAARAADLAGDVIIGWHSGMRVDIFTPSIPFAWEAMNTVVRVQGPGGNAAYLSAEALAVFKLLFFRPKDILDVEKLIQVQGESFDRSYVREWLVQMMGEDDERVIALDNIV